MSDLVFILIHSPLVGPLTWKPVAADLADRGHGAIVPVITSAVGAGPPYWRRHSQEVVRDLDGVPVDRRLVLVAHSGAGALLPAIKIEAGREVAAYVFVDAGIPEDGKSRFDLFGDEKAVAGLRATVQHGLLPPWNRWFPDATLEELLPDASLRHQFLAELRPTPLTVYEEPVPVFAAWPDAPCAYLQLSPAYDREAAAARKLGWPVRNLDAGHFHMLTDPPAVADALLALIGSPVP